MQRSRSLARDTSLVKAAILLTAMLSSALALAQESATTSPTLDRVRANGKLTLGYYADAAPMSYKGEGGKAAGYAVALCEQVAAQVKTSLALPSLATEYVPVGNSERFSAVREGRIDLLCGPSVATISRRSEVSFSIPILISGAGVLVRSDVSDQLRDALESRTSTANPVWRGSPGLAALQQRKFLVVSGTTTEALVKQRASQLKINSTVTPVSDHAAGAREVREGRADALFGELYILLNLAKQNPDQLVVLNQLVDVHPMSLALARGDEDFRLLVDKTLSELYRSGKISAIYAQSFGAPDAAMTEIFHMLAEPE